ncbi:hypothetical protein B7P43_G10939 [Cryptotermes secundus]|uniref:Uncharacterized protein n=1 Tax=Cryptotermes secundus TaxID=105785 RepID=A0A2J7Q9U7_9NEOP|nr:hypothetical protein B7P43_G10939 [Cryptotermes secundus]
MICPQYQYFHPICFNFLSPSVLWAPTMCFLKLKRLCINPWTTPVQLLHYRHHPVSSNQLFHRLNNCSFCNLNRVIWLGIICDFQTSERIS